MLLKDKCKKCQICTKCLVHRCIKKQGFDLKYKLPVEYLLCEEEPSTPDVMLLLLLVSPHNKMIPYFSSRVNQFAEGDTVHSCFFDPSVGEEAGANAM